MSGFDSGAMGHTPLSLASIASTRAVNLAIISFSLVGMTRTVTRLASVEITAAFATLRASCSSLPGPAYRALCAALSFRYFPINNAVG